MQITIREPGSAITHFIAMMFSTFASIPLLIKSGLSHNPLAFKSLTIFIISMILLYAASTAYHSVNLTGSSLKLFKKLDHMMIFILIAGSYTPVCACILQGPLGDSMLATIWIIAAIGILMKGLWVTCPKWVSSVIYIAMGWVVIFAFKPLYHILSLDAFLWLLTGGIIYTAGGIIYALKLPLFNARHKQFGSHEVFHLFVMGGSLCHFIFMYQYVA